jgi:hypothetical protein
MAMTMFSANDHPVPQITIRTRSWLNIVPSWTSLGKSNLRIVHKQNYRGHWTTTKVRLSLVEHLIVDSKFREILVFLSN